MRSFLEEGEVKLGPLGEYVADERAEIGDPLEGRWQDLSLTFDGEVVGTTPEAHANMKHGAYCMVKVQRVEGPHLLGDGPAFCIGDHSESKVVLPSRLVEGFGHVGVLVLDCKEFINRFNAAARGQGLEMVWKEVRYVPNVRPLRLEPFEKVDDFRHQAEFRGMTTTEIGPKSLILRIGSIRDIAKLVKFA